MKLSKRSQDFTQSEIRSMTKECNKVDGINMAQGVCDLEVPPIVMQSAKEAMDNGINIYTPSEGLPELRIAIADKMKRFYDLEIDGMSEVMVSDGATGAFYTAVLSLLNPEDEVILFEPYYGYHKATLNTAGVRTKYVRMEAPHWEIDFSALEEAVSDKTRGILICNPGNPSGKVFTLSELEALGAFATKHDLVVFSDEMYEHFLYDEVQHIPALSVSSLKERTVQISGFSKVFSVTGWRIGYAIASKEIIAAMANYNDLIYVCAPAPLQIGVSEGLKQLDDSYYIDLAKVHQEKRDLFCTALEEVGLNPSVPKGAYYVMCDVSSVEGSDDKAKALHILKTTGVASVAGRAFYHDASGSNMVRFCYSKPIDVLKEAAQQIRKLG